MKILLGAAAFGRIARHRFLSDGIAGRNEQYRKAAILDRIRPIHPAAEIAEEDIQRSWQVYEILGYTDEEIRHAIRDLAKNEYLRRRANSASDEYIREVNRQRRTTGAKGRVTR